MALKNNLISRYAFVEVPYIVVSIGQYSFGTFKGRNSYTSSNGYIGSTTTYPNYIKSLSVTKINGKVNQYVLVFEYTIRDENDDPNFFEKVISSVSKTRSIKFSYGDLSLPNYVYRDEEALITNITSSFSIRDSRITYTVNAISKTLLLNQQINPYYEGYTYEKPSKIIKDLIKENRDGILDIFYGMKNGLTIKGQNLIPEDDKPVEILAQTNISVLEYLRYLVDCMVRVDSDDVLSPSVYSLVFVDDIQGELNGPYFKIVDASSKIEQSDAYELDIGVQNKDVVFNFNLEDDEDYSIYYDYMEDTHPDMFVKRLNEKGEEEMVYAPLISSTTSLYRTTERDKSWWSKVVSFPIKASVTIKGLLRPALLMTHIRLNVMFYGNKHISSGLYIVTKQKDVVDENGFRTELNLTRIKEG